MRSRGLSSSIRLAYPIHLIGAIVSVTFADLGLPPGAITLLHKKGIIVPFPIQAAVLPDALAKKDICGRAPTGSGKTLAFGLPLMLGIKGANARPRRPLGLVLLPTRELAAQVYRELTPLLALQNQTAVTVYGGTRYDKQCRALHRGVEVVLACPGRLEDLVKRGEVILKDIKVVVIDEADRMADMGFMPAVRRLLDQIPSTRQTMLFSATLDSEVDLLVHRYQQNPCFHQADTSKESVGEVDHMFWKVEHSKRVGLVARLITDHPSTLIFCRTRRGADRLSKQLSAIGIRVMAIHGDRTQAQRERALLAFSTGSIQVLVATDVAARGIHVDNVSCVVHFDLPDDHKDYVHRSGRTGRAGANGTVVSLVVSEQIGKSRRLQRSLGLSPAFVTPDVSDLPDLPRIILMDRHQDKHPSKTASNPGSTKKSESNTLRGQPRSNAPKSIRRSRKVTRDERRPEQTSGYRTKRNQRRSSRSVNNNLSSYPSAKKR
ncbi:MAG: DEAD/DEAH box helicase [Actinobacteria bacterium]|nr:DEAD/DEAH box helicase [Actinomycetota bacterium]MCL6104586.1 DEAD/DEAH box helicase [Actinomycetota bacterium]